MSVGSVYREIIRYRSRPNDQQPIIRVAHDEEPDMRILSAHYVLEVHKEFVTYNSGYLDRLMARRAHDSHYDGKTLPTIRVHERDIPPGILDKFLSWLYDTDIVRTAMFTAENICEYENIANLLDCEGLRRACRERSHQRPDYGTWANVEYLLRMSIEYDLPIVRRHLIKFLKNAPAEKLMQVLYLAETYDVPEVWPERQDLWRRCPPHAMGSGFYNRLSADVQRDIAIILNMRKQGYGLCR
ncbi:hypothetical protein HDU89_004851 [Geranomyces variabilis]|nr:hypothetical protein HDU89_004851 [Geranomyces variabilis]